MEEENGRTAPAARAAAAHRQFSDEPFMGLGERCGQESAARGCEALGLPCIVVCVRGGGGRGAVHVTAKETNAGNQAKQSTQRKKKN